MSDSETIQQYFEAVEDFDPDESLCVAVNSIPSITILFLVMEV